MRPSLNNFLPNRRRARHFLWASILLLSTLRSQAQNPYEFWSKLAASRVLDSHWKVAADIQYRRQSDYFLHQKDPFQYDLAFALRAWVYYKLPDKWTIESAPVAYFKDVTLKNARGDISLTHELRTLWGISKGYQWGKLQNANRVFYEFSMLNYASQKMILRHRYRLFNSLDYPVLQCGSAASLRYYLFNEIFFKTQRGQSSFDQNHLFNGIKWKMHNEEWVLGYQFDYQRSGTSYQNKNQFLVMVNFNLSPRKFHQTKS